MLNRRIEKEKKFISREKRKKGRKGKRERKRERKRRKVEGKL